jgi:hypothetical protein
MSEIPAYLNDLQARWNIGQAEGPSEAVKAVWPIENRYAPLSKHQTCRGINLDLTKLQFEVVSTSIKTACCHDHTRSLTSFLQQLAVPVIVGKFDQGRFDLIALPEPQTPGDHAASERIIGLGAFLERLVNM